MNRIISLISVLFILNACSSVNGKYVSIENGDMFFLTETSTESGKGGAFKDTEYVFGLAKGKYIAVGKDAKGTYYRGPSRCVILLTQELAIRYRKDGIIPSLKEKWEKIPGLFSGVEGGIFIPFYLSKSKPYYYYYQDSRALTGDSESNISPSPSDTVLTEDVAISEKPSSTPSSADTNMALNIAQNTTGSPANVTANAVGATAGLAVGNYVGKAGLQNMQGNIIAGPDVKEPRIIEAINHLPTNH